MPDRAALVTALILDRPLCGDCLGVTSGYGWRALDATLTTVAGVLRLRRAIGRCRTCGTTTTVLSVDRPAGADHS
jgi:hypothetical protein